MTLPVRSRPRAVAGWDPFRELDELTQRVNSLWEANLGNADLRGADLRNAKLDHADLRGADITDAKLEGASFKFALLGQSV